MANNEYTPLAVIGAGPGGYAAAFLAADMGMEVTLIDPEPHPGGVCLYRGCIPSKALLHVAKLIHDTQAAATLGVCYGKPEIDLTKLRSWQQDVVKKLTAGLGRLTQQRKIRYLQGRGIFKSATQLHIALNDGKKQLLRFENAILATGSSPATVPNIQIDSPQVMNSTAALELQEIPESILVIGGGYIGLELGSVYAALGSEVTVVEMTSSLLPGADKDLVRVLQSTLGKKFSSILLNTKVVDVQSDVRGVVARLQPRDQPVVEKHFRRVLYAVGRKPNSDQLGLQEAGVDLDERGFVKVDSQLRTSQPTIFAIGDVTGEPMLAHRAAHQGRIAIEVVAGHKSTFVPRAIPAVVFTDPEVAWCGLTEAQAQKQQRHVQVVRFPWAASGRALTIQQTDGLTKMVIDPETERILGVGIVGPGAGELIAEGVLAIEMAAVAADVQWTIHPHPTLSETIMETAEMFSGHSTHIYRPKRQNDR